MAALAAGQVSESVGRLICLWTDKLPEKFRDESDELLVAAAAAGLGLEDLAALFAEMYERARGDLPDEDPDREFDDRAVKLATTFGGAGRPPRGPDRRSAPRWWRRCWTRCPPRPGKRMTGPGTSGTTTRCRGDAPIGLLHREFDHIDGDAHPAAIVT